jgi:anti-sigma factor RsiW
MSDQLTHDEAQELFSDRYDGTLAPDRAAALKAHLDGCESCRAEQVRFEDTMKALKTSSVTRAPRPPDQKEFTERVERTIEQRSAGRFFGKRSIFGRLPIAVISLIMLVLVLLLLILSRRSTTGSLKEPIQHPHTIPDDVRRDLPRP